MNSPDRSTLARVPLSDIDFALAADALGCQVAAIRAVCAVEAPRGGFLSTGEPTILFERHIFSRQTGRRFDKTYPAISNLQPGGYLGGAAEHARLGDAAKLDREAALKAASWGKFQIMGFNFAACGFATLQSFINAMYDSEAAQLKAFVGFIKASPGLLRAIQAQDWTTFARLYNGADYAKNKYDTKLAQAFRAAQA